MCKPGYETRSGPMHPRWSEDRMIAPSGYVKIRVGRSHPLADPNGYAYEHLVVWVSAGLPKPPSGWLLHHRNEVKTDNRLDNLEMKERERHSIHHAAPLSDEQVRIVREKYARREADTPMLAAEFGVPAQSIWKLIRGRTRKSAGGPIQHGSLRGRRLVDAMIARGEGGV